MPDGRVLIAFDDDPLEPNPTWTRVDDETGVNFPAQFVSGYDTKNGRQTLLSQSDTGSGTVYINDHVRGLFDPRNTGSPYYGKLDGKQIMLQLRDPVRDVWEQQFQGLIDYAGYDIDPATDANGVPINASIQLNCVDVFDYLNGYGLTPGLDGVRPMTGGADGVWYAATEGEVIDRILAILNDVGLDESRYIVFSGNVAVQAVKYDPGESALTALRDACDAEFPFIANMYVDRFGRFVFHGRYGRFDPDDLSIAAGPDRWDWHSWLVGDGAAIADDGDRAQMRVLSFERGRPNVVNVAVSYPANMDTTKMANQVFANTGSITQYGLHAAPPMSDLLTAKPINDNLNGHPTWDRYTETLKFAELLVKNQKDPRESITALTVKALHPDDDRAASTWALLSQADVSDVVNVKVGYPGGEGFTGGDPDDYFLEGRQLRVRTHEPRYDYVELDLEVSPRVWSSDTHGVFPPWPGGGT